LTAYLPSAIVWHVTFLARLCSYTTAGWACCATPHLLAWPDRFDGAAYVTFHRFLMVGWTGDVSPGLVM